MVSLRSTLSLLVAAVVIVRLGHARADDDWLGRDKALHATASAGLAASGYAIGSLWFDGRGERAATGIGVALAAGAAKEAWDAVSDGDASWKDATWDAIGTAVGVGVALLIDHLVSR